MTSDGRPPHEAVPAAAREEHKRLDEARLEILFELSRMEVADLDSLLGAVLERVVAHSMSRYGFIQYYDEETEVFTPRAWSRGVMAECGIGDKQRTSTLAETGLWSEAVRQRRPIVVNDFTAPNPLKRGLPPGHARLIRFMTVPVFGRGRIVAVAGVANKASDYTDVDVGQLSQIMDGAWRLAERQKAEDDLRRLAQDLEARVEDRTRELELANGELAEANFELAAANTELQRLLDQQESLQAELAYRALHDPLTGLANRSLFRERLEYAARTSPRGVGVVIVDLDRFKEVNDIFGHAVGDEMLTAVADRLRDVVRERDDIARLGGDEFGIVLPNVIETEAQMVGERVLAAMTDASAFRLRIGASVGVGWQSGATVEMVELIRRADTAMYRAKATGGGVSALY
jgi:diguanylate cyclase (GGDEF)-like protein